MAGITESDLIEELRRENEASKRRPGEITVSEIAAAMTIGYDRAARIAKNKVDAGEWVCRTIYDRVSLRNKFVFSRAVTAVTNKPKAKKKR